MRRLRALLTYLADVRKEMKDVSFPDWRQVLSTTIAVAIVGLVACYLYVLSSTNRCCSKGSEKGAPCAGLGLGGFAGLGVVVAFAVD
jgi:SecE/Sec61-gamma subunits of protein translocation complex